MTNILCHIVGMNNMIKEGFIKQFNDTYPHIIIKDIDIITNDIRNDKKMITLNKKLNNTKGKDRTPIARQISDYWKESLSTKLSDFLNKNTTKDIVILGLSTYHRNHRISINIDTDNKFFIKINPKMHAKNIIEYNINKYKNEIINGTFPIRHLDHDFLISQRDRLINIYQNKGYKLKTVDNIIKWLDLKIETDTDILHTNNIDVHGGNPLSYKETNENELNIGKSKISDNKYIYIGSQTDYKDKITFKKNCRKSRKNIKDFLGRSGESSVQGYNQKWLALLASVPNLKTHIRKGFIEYDNKITPFIEEIHDGAFKQISSSCYIYKALPSQFDQKTGWYKYKTNKTIEFIEKDFIPDIFEELKRENIKIIEFKN